MCVRDFICGSLVGMVVGLTAAPAVMAQTNGIREVSASERSLISLQTRLRYTTMIVLPDEEEILDIICGDRDFWVISATQNIARDPAAQDPLREFVLQAYRAHERQPEKAASA